MKRRKYSNHTVKRKNTYRPRRKTSTRIYIILICIFAVFSLIKNPPFSLSRNAEPGGIRDVPTIGRAISEDLDPDEIPDYAGTPSYVINGNKPFFTDEEYADAEQTYIDLPELDYLGRCGCCQASLGKDTLAEEERGDISSVRPSGWHQEMYPTIISANDGALYNRCHLLMYAMTGLNAEPRNLITGTAYMNNSGMLPYETAVQNWIYRHDDRILYRVTPVFKGSELVARGVHIEAGDVSSKGRDFHINVYCYNVQPGVIIDYKTGYSKKDNTRE